MTTGGRALIAALCFWVSPVSAQDRAHWGLPELMQELRAVSSARGTFVETKYLAVLSQPLELSGTLSYRAPDRLEKRTLRPTAERVVLEGDTLTIENRKGRRSYSLEQNPAMRALVESIRSTLAGDLDTLQHFYDVALAGERGAWRLQLKPTDAAMRSMVSEIQIGGRGARIDLVEVQEAGGDRSVMKITSPAS